MHHRDAYRVFLVLEAALATAGAIYGTVSAVYRIEAAGLNPLQLVLVGTALEGAYFIANVPTGVVADVYSRRLSVVIGLALIGAGYILEGAIPVFGSILLAQVVWGTGASFVDGAKEAWIAGEIGDERAGRAYLRATQVGQAGGIVGALVSVWLGGIALGLPMIAGGLVCLALAGLAALLMPEVGFVPAAHAARAGTETGTTAEVAEDAEAQRSTAEVTEDAEEREEKMISLPTSSALWASSAVPSAPSLSSTSPEPARGGKERWASWLAEMAAGLRRGGAAVRGSPLLITILSIALFAGMASEGFDRLWGAHLLEDVHLPPIGPFQPVVWFGVISIVAQLLGIVVTEGVRRFVRTDTHAAGARALFAIQALLVLGVIAFGLARSLPLALAAYWAVATLRSVQSPIYVGWLSARIEPRVRATVLSMANQMDALGQFGGGPVLGLIGTLRGIPTALVVAGGALAPALPLVLLARRHGRETGEPLAAAEKVAR